MARRRRRRRLKAGAVLWLLVIVNVTAGLLFSPATSLTQIRVKGAQGSDFARITKELQWLKDKPRLTINTPSVEEQILRRPDVRSANLSCNIFGSELKLAYYEPV